MHTEHFEMATSQVPLAAWVAMWALCGAAVALSYGADAIVAINASKRRRAQADKDQPKVGPTLKILRL
jgi:hypothetical protein